MPSPHHLGSQKATGVVTRLTLVRHGETGWNAESRLQGWKDCPLSARGEAQAQALARRLANDQPFDALYSSDLVRALATAAPISAATGLHIRTEPRLRERKMGILEGLTAAEAEVRHPDVIAAWRDGGEDYTIPDGESVVTMRARVLAAMEDIAAAHPGAHIALVVHGGVIRRVLENVLNLPWDGLRRYLLLNASVNVVERTPSHWTLVTFGDVSHLRHLETLDDTRLGPPEPRPDNRLPAH